MAKAGFVYRRAQVRGLLGGSRAWTVVWAVLLARRLLRKLTTDKPDVVFNERLEAGETILISSREREPRIIGR